MNVTKTKLLFEAHGKMVAGSEVKVGEHTVKIVNNYSTWLCITQFNDEFIKIRIIITWRRRDTAPAHTKI